MKRGLKPERERDAHRGYALFPSCPLVVSAFCSSHGGSVISLDTLT